MGNSKELLKEIYGTEKDPLDVMYETIVKFEDRLPNQFIIHEENMINIEEEIGRKQLLNGLLTYFMTKEEYLKCHKIVEIQKYLNLEQ